MQTSSNKAKTKVIAEIGLNYMGDPTYADYYIRMLALMRSKVDGVTFQVREPAFYARGDVEKTFDLPDDFYAAVRKTLFVEQIKFGITLCDVGKLGFFESIDTDFYKVLSKDINNAELVDALLNTGKPVYVSTGMSDDEEVRRLVQRTQHAPNLNLIHTALSYEDSDTNLWAISDMRAGNGVPVAFGLHSTMVETLYAALAFNPVALFFYVKGSWYPKHRDEKHAVPLSRCQEVIETIRRLEIMMGDGIKRAMENTIPDQNQKK